MAIFADGFCSSTYLPNSLPLSDVQRIERHDPWKVLRIVEFLYSRRSETDWERASN